MNYKITDKIASVKLNDFLFDLKKDALIDSVLLENNMIKKQNIIIPCFWDSCLLEQYICDNSNIKNNNIPCFIFIAQKGGRFNSNILVEKYLSLGGIFVGDNQSLITYLEHENRSSEWIKNILIHPHLIKVIDTKDALRKAIDASIQIHDTDFYSIAITGTSGKTSTTQIIGFLLENLENKEILKIGTMGIQIGTNNIDSDYPTMPDYPVFKKSLEQAKKQQINNLVFEATSHGLIEKRMGYWLNDTAIFTNFSQDHLDFHKTMESYREAKGILFESHLKNKANIILNTEDDSWQFFASSTNYKNEINFFAYGFGNNKQEILNFANIKFNNVYYLKIENIVSIRSGISGHYSLYNKDNILIEQADYHVALIGEFQHENIAASVLALYAKGYTLTTICQKLNKMTGISGRLEIVKNLGVGNKPCILIDYAHKPNALEKTLTTLNTFKGNGRLICVFGCGGDRDKSKRSIMGNLSSMLADISIITSDNPRTEDPLTIINEVMGGIKKLDNIYKIINRREAIAHAFKLAQTDDIIVIAGKGNENYQIIGYNKYHFSDYEEAIMQLKQY